MGLKHELDRSSGGAVHRLMARLRGFLHHHPALLLLYRTLVIVVGTILMLMGLIMLVTPGPGWLFIFMGMGLWGTEFHWAHRVNVWGKKKVLDAWNAAKRKRYERHLRQRARIWQSRENQTHFCPTGTHYHS